MKADLSTSMPESKKAPRGFAGGGQLWQLCGTRINDCAHVTKTFGKPPFDDGRAQLRFKFVTSSHRITQQSRQPFRGALMDLANITLSASMLQRLADLKNDNHVEAKRRLAAIEQAMTPQWKQTMHDRITSLSRQSAASRSKLPKLYVLMEEVGELRSPHVSCKAGCSACCRTIPVEISDLEARHIAAATGKTMANLPPGRHTQLKDVTTPCPFLVENQCSIYEHRPYNCRSLAAVDRDALSCSDENTALTRAKDPRAVPVVMTKMQAFDPLYREIVDRKPAAWADIRQFFPTMSTQSPHTLNSQS